MCRIKIFETKADRLSGFVICEVKEVHSAGSSNNDSGSS